MEAIILAGGLGTRLRERVPDLPKCLANVGGRPFLYYIINNLQKQHIKKFIFSLGYKSELILEYLNNNFKHLDFSYVVEKLPLGTGGAIRLALEKAIGNYVIVTNGDTLFKGDFSSIYQTHINNCADCTVVTKKMSDFDRYGKIEIDEKNKIKTFSEKGMYKDGLINAGTYLINKTLFQQQISQEVFSFERNYLESNTNKLNFFSHETHGYFVDIGVPEDYEKANRDLAPKSLNIGEINKSWTLFLDRDGVINKEITNDYVRSIKDFDFYPGALEAIKIFRDFFGIVVITTNQRGIGKNLMSISDLEVIHQHMLNSIHDAGGKIDAIYYCHSLNEKDFNRKPNPGMAFQAVEEYPEIDLEKSMMVGNKKSDMKFARITGMHSIFIASTNPEITLPDIDIDLSFDSLVAFANFLEKSL